MLPEGIEISHIAHIAQQWSEFLVGQMNNILIKARLKKIEVPPQLEGSDATTLYMQSNHRLLILGFDETLTESAETLGRRGDQINEMEPKLNPALKRTLTVLSNDPNTTVLILSGSTMRVLDDNFGEYNMWLAAENGMFLRSTKGTWMTTMIELLNIEWIDSVKHMFEFFTERTPRSYIEQRDTSISWNYKYSDVEFGTLQAKDMMQHLWKDPISNSTVDVFQGSCSVEVRPFGVTKGAAIEDILGEIYWCTYPRPPIDYVLCLGHFLGKDEDLCLFFEPDPPSVRTKATEKLKLPFGKCLTPKLSSERRTTKPHKCEPPHSFTAVDLLSENYFSCAVGRTRTTARYMLESSDDVVTFLNELAMATCSTSSCSTSTSS